MKLIDILRIKGTLVHSIAPQAKLSEAIRKLVEFNIGSLVVCEDLGCHAGHVLGIVTERDILRSCDEAESSLSTRTVAEVMSKNLIVGAPHDSIDDTMGLMTEHRIRHLPVMDGDELKGMISIGDVVKAHHHLAVVENHYLKSYIQS